MTSPSLNDIYEAIGGLRVEVQASISRGKDQENRIRSLELVRNWFAGVAAAVVVMYGVLVKFGPVVLQAVASGS